MAVVGLGFGRSHVAEALRLEPRARLVSVVDRSPDESAGIGGPGIDRFVELSDALAATSPDIVVLATPIHTHAELAGLALRAGAHVLVEKPPTATLAEYEDLVKLSRRERRCIQVGFQARGSTAVAEVKAMIASGRVGTVTGIGVVGRWVRDRKYYRRAPWAGRRALDDRIVMDGALTNPFAHAIDVALNIDDARDPADVVDVEIDGWHAHAIETDDTMSTIITTRRGTRISVGVTLCSDSGPVDPTVTVYGTRGEIRLAYEKDRVDVFADGERSTTAHRRESLLANLVDHMETGLPLVAPIEDAGAFMSVLEAIRASPAPRQIPERFVTWRGADDQAAAAVADVDRLCELVARSGRTFSQLRAPWTVAAVTGLRPA